MLGTERARPENRVGGLDPVFVVCIGARAASSRDNVGGIFVEYDESAAESLKAFNQQLTRNRTGGGLPALNTTFAYDNNGNTLTETAGAAVTSYTWSRDNRLTQVTPPAPGIATQYAYDANGLRVQRVDATGTTRYLLNNPSVVAELDTANVATTRFLNNPQAIDDIISFERGGSTYWPLVDGLGSVYAVADSSGALVHRFDFEVFGVRTDLGGGGPNIDVGYTGRWHDANGLVEHRDRQRNPSVGGWLQVDRSGMVDGPNVYSFARGSPAIGVDPTGNNVIVWFWGPDGGETNFGHTVLGITLGPAVAVFGLWPNNRVAVGLGRSSPSHGEPTFSIAPGDIETYASDEGRSADAIVEIETSRSEDDAILAKAAGSLGSYYNLISNNCATFVAQSLLPIGFDARLAIESVSISPPPFSGYKSPLVTSTPRRLYKTLTVYGSKAISGWGLIHRVAILRDPRGKLGAFLPYEVGR